MSDSHANAAGELEQEYLTATAPAGVVESVLLAEDLSCRLGSITAIAEHLYRTDDPAAAPLRVTAPLMGTPSPIDDDGGVRLANPWAPPPSLRDASGRRRALAGSAILSRHEGDAFRGGTWFRLCVVRRVDAESSTGVPIGKAVARVRFILPADASERARAAVWRVLRAVERCSAPAPAL